jgi:putative membrane protein
MMHWGSYGWGMGLGWIYMVVLWALVITAVVYLVKFVERKSADVWHETPLEALKRRYAKGEITKEEFEGMKKDLRKS